MEALNILGEKKGRPFLLIAIGLRRSVVLQPRTFRPWPQKRALSKGLIVSSEAI